MNVGELKKILEGVNDDVIVVGSAVMETGRSFSGGKDFQPNASLYEKGQFDWFDEEEDEEMSNDQDWLVIKLDVEEEWCE